MVGYHSAIPNHAFIVSLCTGPKSRAFAEQHGVTQIGQLQQMTSEQIHSLFKDEASCCVRAWCSRVVPRVVFRIIFWALEQRSAVFRCLFRAGIQRVADQHRCWTRQHTGEKSLFRIYSNCPNLTVLLFASQVEATGPPKSLGQEKNQSVKTVQQKVILFVKSIQSLAVNPLLPIRA